MIFKLLTNLKTCIINICVYVLTHVLLPVFRFLKSIGALFKLAFGPAEQFDNYNGFQRFIKIILYLFYGSLQLVTGFLLFVSVLYIFFDITEKNIQFHIHFEFLIVFIILLMLYSLFRSIKFEVNIDKPNDKPDSINTIFAGTLATVSVVVSILAIVYR